MAWKTKKTRVTTVMSMLDERQTRIYPATEAEVLGWGEMTRISWISSVDKDALAAGKIQLDFG